MVDFLFARVQKRGCDFTQSEQLFVADVLALILGEGKKVDGTIRAEPDQHTKAAPFALPRTSSPLLNDLAAKIGVDQATLGTINGLNKGCIVDAMVAGELRKRFGFENTHNRLSSSMNYRL